MSRTVADPSGERGHAPDTSPYPDVEAMADALSDALGRGDTLGLISLVVAPRAGGSAPAGWRDYDRVHDDLRSFLDGFLATRMRDRDGLFASGRHGNGFVLVLAAPRMRRRLEFRDVARVRERLERAITAWHERRREGRARDIEAPYRLQVGGAMLRPDPGVGPARVIHRALDEAFADGGRARARSERAELGRLRRVIDGGRVRAVYQPVVDPLERRILGVEALTRVPPDDFSGPESLFRAATNHDAIWTLERLCRARALDALPVLEPDQAVFLNVEPASLEDPELLDGTFADKVARAGLTPSRVVLEVTERSALEVGERLRPGLERFRRGGFRLAIDDVGNGHSGLRAIAELAPDYLKIDRTLVRDVHRRPIQRALIATLTRFAETTGMRIVAEGVEQPDELSALLDAGVPAVQGYLFSRPSPRPRVEVWPEPARKAG